MRAIHRLRPLTCLRYLTTTQVKPLTLRPYQERCIQSCLDAFNSGKSRIGVSLPTGGGKTVIFSNLIGRLEGNAKALILVHRQELAFQAMQHCKRTYPEKNVQIEMGDYHADPSTADIIIGMVQSLSRGRLEKYDPEDFKLLIIDEAHHSTARTYMDVVEHMSTVPLVGFSATFRRDDDDLDKVFDEIVFHMDLEEMIMAKHLTDAKFTTVRLVDADMNKVKSKGGEFVIKSLSNTMNTEQNNRVVLQTYFHFVQTEQVRSTLVFAVDIQHATDLCSLFKANDVNAEVVTSKTKKLERQRITKQFKDGEISVLINCGIFTEGTDMPNIDCILLVRPTQSKNLLIQMIGRGLRLHGSKDFCHVVDFVGINSGSVVSVPTLKGLPSGLNVSGMSMEEMEAKREEMKKYEEKKKAEELQKQEEWKEKETQLLRDTQQYLIDNTNEVQEIEGIDLTTFHSYSNFINNTDENILPPGSNLKGKYDTYDEYLLTAVSELAWIKGSTSNIWVLPLADSNGLSSHLRLQIHPNGLSEEFLKEVDLSEFYKPGALSKINNKIITLAKYQERERYKFKKSQFDRYQKRWDARLVAPVIIGDLRPVVSKYSPYPKALVKMCRGKNPKRDVAWRKEPATDGQVKFIAKLIKKYMTEWSPAMRRLVESRLKMENKGAIGDIITAYTIFKSGTLKRDLKKYAKDIPEYHMDIPAPKAEALV